MAVKEKLSKQKLLERLLGKKEPLTEMETSLKLKLMSEMLSSRTCEGTGAARKKRRFRMNKELFMRIVDGLSENVPFFQQRRDATGRLGLSPLQKCTTAK
ncbi:BnaC04g51740D [Brassica napus]|uniref:BnaC04g51740D protein n=1 Tax=Brassica napus TaxID=3708 RepID=A0A078JLN4_BRANA|nr:BnaC04g51740D [Brassica napus]